MKGKKYSENKIRLFGSNLAIAALFLVNKSNNAHGFVTFDNRKSTGVCKNAFSNHQCRSGIPSRTPSHAASTTKLHYLPDVDDVLDLMNVFDSVMRLGGDVSYDAMMGEDVVNDSARLMSSLVPFVTPELMLVKLSSILGRLFLLTTESFMGPNEIDAEESIISTLTLGTSTFILAKTVVPSLMTMFQPLEDRDLLAYERVFRSAGLSWIQFKTLYTEGVVDWVHLEPDEIIVDEEELNMVHEELSSDNVIEVDDNEYLYWLYCGDVNTIFKGSVCHRVHRSTGVSIDDPTSIGLIADMRFVYLSDVLRKQKQQKMNKMITVSTWADMEEREGEFMDYLWSTYKAGEAGATLMRINSRKCLDLIQDDPLLESSFQLLLMKSIDTKYRAILSDSKNALPAVSEEGGERP